MTEQQQHPISPPQELRDRWLDEAPDSSVYDYLIDKSSQWSADQELEACREWANSRFLPTWGDELYAARRPEPLSLREQALTRTTAILNDPGRVLLIEVREILELNLRALEALPE